MGRTIIVGDVHGCAQELGDLLDAVKYAQGVDRLVFVGDLVARGPDSRGAIERVRSAGGECVRGNHDHKLTSWWHSTRGRSKATHSLGPKHAAAVAQLDEEHFAYLDALPLAIELAAHALVVAHAGLVPGVALDAQDPHLVMNLRSIDDDGRPTRKLDGTPWAKRWKGPMHVVFGHDARRKLQLEARATGLDTGCCYGRELTALVLDAGEPIPSNRRARRKRLRHVPARAAWCPMGDGNGDE